MAITLKRKLFYIFYNTVSSKLTDNKSIKPLKVFRCFIVKNFITSIGTNVNINKRAEIGYGLSIGSNSGVGRNSILQGDITIGNGVMKYIQGIMHLKELIFLCLNRDFQICSRL